MYQAMIMNQPQLTVPLPHRNVQVNRENVNMDRVEGLIGMIGDQIGLNGGLEFAPFQANEVVAPLPVAARPPTPPVEPVAEPVVEGFAADEGRVPLSYYTDMVQGFIAKCNLSEQYTVNQAFFLGCTLGSLDGAILGLLFPRAVWNVLMAFYVLVFSLCLYIAGNIAVPPKYVSTVKYMFVFSICMILILGVKRIFG